MPCTFFLPVLFTISMSCGHMVAAKKFHCTLCNDNKKDSDSEIYYIF